MTSVAFIANGTALASAVADGNGNIDLWNIATQTVAATFTDPQSRGVDAVAFTLNSTTLAIGNGNGNTYLWHSDRRRID